MLSFLNKYAGNVHSQNGEDHIIWECVTRLGLKNGHAVEVGANDGRWMSNTRLLVEWGWSCVFVEADWNLFNHCKANWADDLRVRVQCSRVDGNNVNAFVDDSCDLLSTDTDGTDFEIFAGLIAKPKIVIIEIDSAIPPGVLARDDGFLGTYSNTVALGIYKGYFLLCHTGNLIFIDNKYRDLFPEIEGDGLTNSELYFNRGWLKEEAA